MHASTENGADPAAPPYTVGDHLVDRLAGLGVDRVFGVPGDYSLRLLDHVAAHPTVRWTGCATELGAGYAADGYGRLRGMAALFTTFGVGELSAVNAVAGSYAEHVPVVHVVGAPALARQAEHRALHHTLGDGSFEHFAAMHADITCARAVLAPGTAVAEIDRVLMEVRDRRLPGYLLVPADVAELPAERAAAPLPPRADGTDPEVLEAFATAAGRLLAAAGSTDRVTVLAGLLAHRFGAQDDLTALLAAGPLPHATTPWAKSLLDETAPGFSGTYAGAAGSTERTREVVEDASVLVLAGVQFTDLNSGLFSQVVTRARTIELNAGSAAVGAAVFTPLELPAALGALRPLVAALRPGALPAALEADDGTDDGTDDEDHAPLSQAALWRATAAALRPGDVVLADQGTSFYGMAPHRLPAGVTFIGQPLWASIGYTLPALLGAGTAAPGRRGVLLIGDGAAQMTVQELSTVLREELPALVVVVDNDGYTVERAIHGPDQPYNDVPRWDWTALPAVFCPGGRVRAVRASTVGALRRAYAEAAADPGGLTLVQAVVPRDDVPALLATLTRALGRGTAGGDR
ncbi:alpha-keto acid decarboxylase family protein [Modestobacter versicolor]|uniref:Alpha-keto-acid decarboxylase n=1 Tax=Modestobacter versicolor TaxID=429133 RepID=A0A323VG19_9ACTN|nr:thiamine pyrophosphate-binding protein [Modestobacter versicolor]MBB3675191.1 indolepyruvate decarboxylase [Modestobacter versicolor]PZA22993.1 indolepyruvate decarboxylase [Modestobacter versicolor]